MLLWLWGRRSLRIETISISLILLWIHSVATIDVRLSVKNALFNLVAFRFLEEGMEKEGERFGARVWVCHVYVYLLWASEFSAKIRWMPTGRGSEACEQVCCFYIMVLMRFFRYMWTSVLPLLYASYDFLQRHVTASERCQSWGHLAWGSCQQPPQGLLRPLAGFLRTRMALIDWSLSNLKQQLVLQIRLSIK